MEDCRALKKRLVSHGQVGGLKLPSFAAFAAFGVFAAFASFAESTTWSAFENSNGTFKVGLNFQSSTLKVGRQLRKLNFESSF